MSMDLIYSYLRNEKCFPGICLIKDALSLCAQPPSLQMLDMVNLGCIELYLTIMLFVITRCNLCVGGARVQLLLVALLNGLIPRTLLARYIHLILCHAAGAYIQYHPHVANQFANDEIIN